MAGSQGEGPAPASFFCPRCKTTKLELYLSLLAPVYETYICRKCCGIWYDLAETRKVPEIRREMNKNTAMLLKDKKEISRGSLPA